MQMFFAGEARRGMGRCRAVPVVWLLKGRVKSADG